MVTNFVGIQRDFTVPCGVRADVGIRVKRADGSPAAVSRATWRLGIWRDGAEAEATRFGELLPAPDGAGEGDLFWRFPALEVGMWRYELVASGNDGEVSRVFYGVIGSAEASDIVADGDVVGVHGWRMLEVLLPVDAGGKVEAHWLSGDYVLALCEVARGYAERAEAVEAELDAAVDEATRRAESAAARAESAAASAEDDAASAKADRQAIEVKFQETDAFIDGFYDVALRVIVPNQVTGTWWVGGRDSKQPFQGDAGYSPQISTAGYWLVWSDGQVVESDTRARAEDGFSPYVDALGMWVYFDSVTGQIVNGPSAVGRDGLDGTAVRRIVVDSYEDIPQEGESCNGGVYYYVANWATEAIGNKVLMRTSRWSYSAGPVYFSCGDVSGGLLLDYDSAEDFADDINNGNWAFTARVVSADVVELSVKSGEDYTFYVFEGHPAMFKVAQDYEVYAWLEEDGVGRWVCVGLANDLATAEVHGLVKLGTDVRVVAGAPVGNNANGQMMVPVASATVPGTVRPASATVSSDGGGTHMTGNGVMMVDSASTQVKGAVQLSCGEEIPAADDNIGLRSDGKIGVRRATLNEFGSVRLGSQLQQVARIPYLLSVGSITDESKPGDLGKLANNLLLGGALQHGLAAYWASGGRTGIDGVDTGNLTEGVFYLGLYTSPSFKQSEDNGLELNEASGSLLGGVRKMYTLASGSDVPTGDAVLDYLGLHYYRKESVYTKTELTRDGGVIDTELQSRVPLYAEKELAEYVKKADADSLYAKASTVSSLSSSVATIQSSVTAQGNSISAISKDVETLKNADSGYLKMVGAFAGTIELWGGSAEEFAKADITGKRMFMTLEN